MWPVADNIVAPRRTGYVFEEVMMWHNPGNISFSEWIEPTESWENSHTKRRIHNLLEITGLIHKVVRVKARKAEPSEVQLFHTEEYVNKIRALNETGGEAGHFASFSKGGYDIALLSAGGVLAGVEAIIKGEVRNAYCLVRPPGHHAERDQGMGFCIFNNIAIGALHARVLGMHRIAIVDYDVHHGNGTEQAFWSDPNTLFISLHQDSNYPIGTGRVTDIGGAGAERTTINIPLPPGSGCGAYRSAFQHVVIPALQRFQPDFIFVSSGFDASFNDPLAAMMLSSNGFRDMAEQLVDAAEALCGGRLLFAHEGGYSKDYVPFCGLAVIEALCGVRSGVEDPYLDDVDNWGYQECQPHQLSVISRAAELAGLSSVNTSSVEATLKTALDALGMNNEEKIAVLQKLLQTYK